MEARVRSEREYLACCGSSKFAKEMAKGGPFSSYDEAVAAARHIWFNKVDVMGWLDAFAAHPQICESSSSSFSSPTNHTSAQWSKGEQSTALATANISTLQELSVWNSRYRQKFGFVFLIFASGRSSPEILAELKRRYENRPLLEFEIAAGEQMKITELRLSKLFSKNELGALRSDSQERKEVGEKAEEDRISIIGAHLTATSESSVAKPEDIPQRTRPPITTHVLDVARGSPAKGIEVKLEICDDSGSGLWFFQGSSVTDKDGRSGQLMSMVQDLKPGTYRLTFNSGKYIPDGFFPYISIVFVVKESQKWEHFHVPLLLSPFSFTTYRGS